MLSSIKIGIILVCFTAGLLTSISAHADNTGNVYMSDMIKIAAIYATTGIAARSNGPSLTGVRLAVDEINETGGILGKKIDLIDLDNKSTAIGSKAAAEEAVRQHVEAIIGAAWSSHSLSIAEIAQKYKIPMITNISTHPEVTKKGDYIFRVCFTDPYQGKILAEFARNDLNAKTADIITNVSNDYSIGLSRNFIDVFTSFGGKIITELHYVQKETDFTELVKIVKKDDPDIVFIPGHYESVLIANELHKAAIRAIPLGGDGWITDNYYSMGGGNIPIAYYTEHWSKDAKNQMLKNFMDRYEKKYNPDSQMVLSYDAVMLFKDAVLRAGSFDRIKIKDALAHTKAYHGLTGMITLDENGDPQKSVVIFKIENGEPHYLKTINP